ncbi:hypothetical protein I4U23_014548 [Adineta vaga]|nr:hypothetical protein I4U23_014548 [Adineta vaga]
MYQCMNSSKCISQHRLLDKVNDCYHKDDENPHLIADSLVYNQLQKYFKCTTTNEYIPQYLVQDGICDCKKYDSNTFCDDEDQHIIYTRNHISFQTICDGFTELLPVMIDGQIETDETNCQQWLCNNTYTRCDGFWNCFDGADEINCDTLPSLVCPLQNHICVSPVTNQMMCLPISKANDGKIDCLGGTDEPKFCRNSNHTLHDRNFYCRNDTYSSCIQRKDLCDTHRNCLHGDDEQFCQNRNNTRFHICDETDALVSTYVENFFCQRRPDTVKRSIVHFALGQVHESNKYRNNLNQILITERTINKKLRCHRGLDLRVWLNKDKNISTMTCLCPPSFYGNMCQYQNQRVSLTIQFSAKSNSRRKPFVIVISLIDDSEERIIHSSRQISYLPMRDCENKFNIYLLYANRPKDHRKLYFIHIDIYEHVSLTYRGSFLFPITFSFLPVQRLTIQVTIPGSNIKRKTYSDNNPCVHGRLIQYINELNILSFCQCYPGWIGQYCSISYPCMCSIDSICSGILANNRSLCICPINKFGSLCLLNNNICQFNNNTQCRNGGQCIPISVDMESQKQFTCICTKGFTGERCEIQDTKIILSFHKQIVLSESMFVHFIQINHDAAPERSTTFRVLGENHDFVTIYWSYPFHLVFVELPEKKYYLTVIKKFYQQSVIIRKTLDSSDRCPHIRELLDKTIVQSHLLRRIKYYHLPCKNHAYHLSCFYDDIHLCVCQNYSQQRIANCFEFNHYMKLDCFGESSCENGAQCFQDNRYCPQTSTRCHQIHILHL